MGRRDQQPPLYRTPCRDGSGHAEGKDKRIPTGKPLPKNTWRSMKRAESSTLGARRHARTQVCMLAYQVGDGLVRGKVNREILQTVFGEAMMTSIAA
ncbi:unnamed protein product [Ectocarpus sp. 4 AP-2014]